MALFVTSVLSFGPRVFRKTNRLHILTGWRIWFMTLGLSNRQVIVDPNKRTVSILDRVLWLFPRRRKFKFDHIRAISYGYSDQNSFGGFNLVRDTYDVFSVGIKLHGEDWTTHLFRFFGDGSFVNEGPLPDWWYWQDYLRDWEGTQESESKHLVNLLFRMTNTTIEPP